METKHTIIHNDIIQYNNNTHFNKQPLFFSNNKSNKNAIIVLVRADIIEFDVDEYDSNYETLDSLPPSFPTSEPSMHHQQKQNM